MDTLEIYLKSGHTITIVCKEWSFEWSHVEKVYVGYSFKGMKSPHRIGLEPRQIAGYAVLKVGK